MNLDGVFILLVAATAAWWAVRLVRPGRKRHGPRGRPTGPLLLLHLVHLVPILLGVAMVAAMVWLVARALREVIFWIGDFCRQF
jgi:hypothetical protein